MESSKPTNNSKSSDNNNLKKENSNKIKSLVEYYFKYNKVPLIQDKFEFKCKPDVLEDTISNKEKLRLDQVFPFKYKIEELDLEVEKFLKVIRNIRIFTEEELDLWIEDFEKISRHKKWNLPKQLMALAEIVRDQSLQNIFSLSDFDKVKKELKKGIVKKTSSSVIHMRLSKCMQVDYRYIREYITELKKLIDKYSKIENLTKSEYNRKLRETFFLNLGFNTRMKVLESSKESLEDMIHYIENIEENLTFEADKRGIVSEDYDASGSKKYVNNKWCTLHKNNTHDSKECLVLTNNTPEQLKKREEEYSKKQGKPDKAFIMKELEFEKLDLELAGQVADCDVKIMIDTGACRNFINKNIVDSKKLKIREDKPINVLTANNQRVILDSVVDTTLRLEGLEKEFNVTFYILDNCTADAILGNTFIFGNEVILDFKNNVLRIGEERINILEENRKLNEENELDRIFFEGLGLIKEDEEEGNELNNLIYSYEKKKQQKF